MRKLARALVTAGAAVTVMIGMTTSASAAANPVSVCGSGYYVQESHDLGYYQGTGGPQARVYLLYNASSGYNCVVTTVVGGQNQGRVSAELRAAGDTVMTVDEGYYNSYAGPVKIRANGQCVEYGGGTDYWTGSRHWDAWHSGLGHCG
ncbi:acetyltransferase [Streptomyces sp. NPDC059650]|uniref:acetyltransferase n=1 Tax=Streptomyces sp. NPDC059650 TaxID=3346896 RepID=UPI0036A62C30